MSRTALVILTALLISLMVLEPVFAREDCVWAARLSEEGVALINDYPSQATNKLKDAILYCGKSASLYYNLGLALYKQNKFSEARNQMETALKLHPDYAKAANDLAYIYAVHLNDKQRAWLFARRAVRLDAQNKDFRETLALTAEIDIEVPPKVEKDFPDAVAVVIGNRNYMSGRIPAVEYAHRDASLVKRYFAEVFGFREGNIVYLTDANASQMKRVLGDGDDHRGVLFDKIKTNASSLIIYYTGHGAHDPATREAYLLPTNADPGALRETSYPLSVLYGNLARINREKRPRRIVLILDASFGGTFQGGDLIRDTDPAGIETTAPLLVLRNAAAFTSARNSQISSWYPEKGHGLFTYLFVQALRERMEVSDKVTVAEIETILLGIDGVNDTARRLYNRDQSPQIVGNKKIMLMQ